MTYSDFQERLDGAVRKAKELANEWAGFAIAPKDRFILAAAKLVFGHRNFEVDLGKDWERQDVFRGENHQTPGFSLSGASRSARVEPAVL